MEIKYYSGFRNSAGGITYIGNRLGDPSFAPYMFKEEDKELALELAMKAANNYPLWSEVFLSKYEG